MGIPCLIAFYIKTKKEIVWCVYLEWNTIFLLNLHLFSVEFLDVWFYEYLLVSILAFCLKFLNRFFLIVRLNFIFWPFQIFGLCQLRLWYFVFLFWLGISDLLQPLIYLVNPSSLFYMKSTKIYSIQFTIFYNSLKL